MKKAVLCMPVMDIVISGEKIYGNNDGLQYDIINYKLFDGENYLIESGPIFLGTALSTGDKFRDDSLIFYDLTPGETYTLQLLDYSC